MPLNVFGQPVGRPLEGWVARPYPEPAPMSGRHVRLEPLDAEKHADGLFRAFSEAPDDRDWTYLADEAPADPQGHRELIRRLTGSRDPMHFAALVDGVPLGRAALMRIDPAHGVIEVGHIAFAPRLKRTAAGTEAIVLLMSQCFDRLGYRRLEWKCDALNAPSRRAAERYGFRFEGIFRNAAVTKNRNRDTAWYSITDEEWPRLRYAFALWLDPLNFDDRGRQKQSLASLMDRARSKVKDGGA